VGRAYRYWQEPSDVSRMDTSVVPVGVAVAALVAVPTTTYSAKNAKPKEIVVVDSKLKKSGTPKATMPWTVRAEGLQSTRRGATLRPRGARR
jgi:hypothetical protein